MVEIQLGKVEILSPRRRLNQIRGFILPDIELAEGLKLIN